MVGMRTGVLQDVASNFQGFNSGAYMTFDATEVRLAHIANSWLQQI